MIKPKGNDIDLMSMVVKQKYDAKSDEEEKSFHSNGIHTKQIQEKEESKHSKDSINQERVPTLENDGANQNESEYNQGKWTDEEHKKFLNGLLLYGKNWN